MPPAAPHLNIVEGGDVTTDEQGRTLTNVSLAKIR
jgi:hypothetical protein